MAEDDIVELLWKSGKVVPSSQTETTSVSPPILRGSGSGGGGEESAPLPLPQPPPLYTSDHNLFIREDEMASWLHYHPLGREEEDELGSHLFYSGLVSTPLQPPRPPPASVIYTPTAAERPTGQVVARRGAENFINFSSLRGNVYTGGRVEQAAAGPSWVQVVRGSTQVGSSATTPSSSSVTESCLTLATVTGGVGVAQTFAVPKAVCEIAGPSSPVVSQTGTEPVLIQPAKTDERKRKEREETVAADDAEGTGGSTSRKRSRAAEMHNLSERRRREKIKEKMKVLQELIPHCDKTDKASMLDDAIEYVKSLQMQIQMMWTRGGMMPMMYNPNMQRFMPPSAMGMMGMSRPPFIPSPAVPFIPFPGTALPRPAHMAGLGPPYPAPRYPIPNIQAFAPSRGLQQPDPVQNQPQFPGYLDPYNTQFVGLQQMQQQPPPPLLQNQTTSQLSISQASSSKEPEDQDNKPTG